MPEDFLSSLSQPINKTKTSKKIKKKELIKEFSKQQKPIFSLVSEKEDFFPYFKQISKDRKKAEGCKIFEGKLLGRSPPVLLYSQPLWICLEREKELVGKTSFEDVGSPTRTL